MVLTDLPAKLFIIMIITATVLYLSIINGVQHFTLWLFLLVECPDFVHKYKQLAQCYEEFLQGAFVQLAQIHDRSQRNDVVCG